MLGAAGPYVPARGANDETPRSHRGARAVRAPHTNPAAANPPLEVPRR